MTAVVPPLFTFLVDAGEDALCFSLDVGAARPSVCLAWCFSGLVEWLRAAATAAAAVGVIGLLGAVAAEGVKGVRGARGWLEPRSYVMLRGGLVGLGFLLLGLRVLLLGVGVLGGGRWAGVICFVGLGVLVWRGVRGAVLGPSGVDDLLCGVEALAGWFAACIGGEVGVAMGLSGILGFVVVMSFILNDE